MRLIDADALSEKLYETTIFIKDGEVFQRMINDAPTVSAETVDCTDFVLWLLDEIMDEENWELNAVAYGEIIARKLKKLGLLEVKDGYYVQTPSAEARPTGEWVQKDMYADRFCSECNYAVWDSEAEEYNYCPNCGAKMYKDGEDE